MLREEDLVTALMAYKQGRSGFVLDPETMEVKSFEDVFQNLTRNRYMIDWKDQPEEKQEPAEEPAEDPKEEPAAAPPAKTKKRGGKQETGKDEELILKAWGGGEHSISEIMRMTGYSYQTVRRHIPISPKG